MINLDLLSEEHTWNNHTMNFIGIYAKNSLNFLLVDMACTLYGITIIPIYDTLGEQATLFAFS